MNRISRSLRILSEEPFRIFFPTGLFLGIVGVSLWLLFYFGAGIPYPGISHARLMIEGFMGSFVLGFLGTAGPRILSSPPLSLREIGTIFTLDLLAAGFHVADAHQIGDVCFVASLLVFICAGVGRFESVKIVLRQILLSLSSDCSAGSPVRRSLRFERAQYSGPYQFGNALLNQGFILLPVPASRHFSSGACSSYPCQICPSRATLPPGWFRQAGFAAFIGVVIIASFLIDIFNLPRAAGCVRLGAIAIYLAVRMPFRGRNFLANCLRAGLTSILVGLAVAALLPNYRIGALHVVFITGFSFMVFTVAIRVIFGHSGNAMLFQKRLPFLVTSGFLLVIAMLSRVTAEFSPARASFILSPLRSAGCWPR